MLSDEILENVIERLTERMRIANENVLKLIAKNIKKLGTMKISDVQRLGQILKYGGDYDKIVQELAKMTQLNEREIYNIFDEVAKQDYEYAERYYKYRNIGYRPYEENSELQNQVRAIARQTAESYMNLSNTRVMGYKMLDSNGDAVFKPLRQAYVDLIDEAIISVSQGKESFNSAMYRQLKEIGSGGLKVYYENGYARRLDTSIRMNLKDGLRQLHNETQRMFGEEFGADGVEISVHTNPAPDHEEVQGRQFSLEEFDKFQNDMDAVDYKGKLFPAEFNGRDRRSISEYNCYHYIFNIILGVNEPLYTDIELSCIIEDNNAGFEFEGKKYTNYEGTQLQRQLETKIRDMKDTQILARESGNKELASYSQMRINQLTNKYNELNKASGLKPKVSRMRVSGYHKIKTEGNRVREVKVNGLKSTLEQPKEVLNEVIDGKFYKSSKIFKASKKDLDLTNNANINIYNGTDKLNIYINERANIKKAYYSRWERKIQTTGVRKDDIHPEATLWHEMGHAIDNYKGTFEYASNNPRLRGLMEDYYRNNPTVPDRVKDYFKGFRERSNQEFRDTHNWQDYYDNYIQMKTDRNYSEYSINVYKEMKVNNPERYEQQVKWDYEDDMTKYYFGKRKTNMEYAQLLNFSDMYSAISKGQYNRDFCGRYGYHTVSYFLERQENPTTELFANFVSMKMLGAKGHLEFFAKECPEIYKELERLYKQIGDDLSVR